MRILVIDDTKAHLDAALQTLTGHDVTTCSSYDKATKLLEIKNDKVEQEKKWQQYQDEGMEKWEAYDKAERESRLPYWDTVLCDLLMPASAENCPGSKYIGEEMPVGWSLALVAAKRGAKLVAVATDMNHHEHPASALLDRFSYHMFTIDGAKVLMTNFVRRVDINGTECPCKFCEGSGKRLVDDGREIECFNCNGSGTEFSEKGKDWGDILNRLQGGDE